MRSAIGGCVVAAKLCMLLAAGIGAACVVGLAQLLRNLPRLGRLRAGTLLASSHTLIVCVFLAVSPWYITAERAVDSPYGDVYLPYLLVPGVHIYQPASMLFGQAMFPWLTAAAIPDLARLTKLRLLGGVSKFPEDKLQQLHKALPYCGFL